MDDVEKTTEFKNVSHEGVFKGAGLVGLLDLGAGAPVALEGAVGDTRAGRKQVGPERPKQYPFRAD